MDTLSIGEVARRAGMRQSAIRYYESVGLLPEPDRKGGWRCYTPEVVERLRVIRAARDLGFALEEIRTLLYDFDPDTPPPERWRRLALEKLPAIDALIGRAVAMRHLLLSGLNCRCRRIEECFLEGCTPAPKGRALPIVAVPAGGGAPPQRR